MRFAIDPGSPEGQSLRAGNIDLVGGRQIYCPPPILLSGNLPDEALSHVWRARIPTPDSRCRVKVSVIFFPSTTVPVDISGQATIWLAAYEQDYKGVSGSSGKTAPVTNVEGTQAAPTTFPATAGLLGYSREFVTAADWVEAIIQINSGQNNAGFWVLQTRIQPDAVTLDWQEWSEIRALFLPQIIDLGTV